MNIWIDGDACPKAIKEIVFRAAIRTQTVTTMIANRSILVPPSPFIKKLVVSSDFDAADNKILELLSVDDLVITADIPFAAEVIEKQAHALNPRGMLYDKNNVKQILSLRDFNQAVRESGQMGGGADKLSAKEIQSFANQLDRLLAQANKE